MVSAFAGLGIIDDETLAVPGSGPAIKELTAGNIQFFGDTELLMKRGDFRPLMVFNGERVESFPNVPTATEVGIEAPLNELYLWGVFLHPQGLTWVTATLEAACEAAVASDGFQDLHQLGHGHKLPGCGGI